MRAVRPGRIRSLVLVALLVVLGAACEVKTQIDVKVEEDGGGTVGVVVTLDKEAADKIADLDQQLRIEDLEQTGWEVTGPTATPDGGVRLTAEKRFTTTDQLGGIMTELTGGGGPLRDFTLERSHRFAKTSYKVTGTADLSKGLETFGDEELRVALGGQALGRTPEELEAEAGRPLSEAAPFELNVLLPNGDTRTFTPVLGGEAVTVEARSSVESSPARLLAGGAVLTALLAILLFWLLATGRIGGRSPEREAWVDPQPRRYPGVQEIDTDDFYEPPARGPRP